MATKPKATKKTVEQPKHEPSRFQQLKTKALSQDNIDMAKQAGKAVGVVAGLGVAVGVASFIADKTYQGLTSFA